MTTTFRRTLASAAAATALLASFALPSYAQTAAPAAPAAAATTTAPKSDRAMHKHGDRMEHMQQRIAKLKADLKLTPAQETAWNTYAATFKPGERPQRMEREDFAKLTTPQRIDKMREMRAQRAADADRRGEATKAFYAQLDASQQKTFDAATLHKGHPGHHGMDHGPRHDHKSGQARPAPAPAQ